MSISRRSLSAAFACTPVLAVPAVAAPAAPSALAPELKTLLIQRQLLQVQLDEACDRLAEAEEALHAATAANPWPAITEHDERIFNFVVRAAHPAGWEGKRLEWVTRPTAWPVVAHQVPEERSRHAARLERIEELRPQVQVVERTLAPVLAAERDAQAAVDALVNAEADMLQQASALMARSLRELIAKACLLGLAVGEALTDEEEPPHVALAYSIARDLIAMGEANV